MSTIPPTSPRMAHTSGGILPANLDTPAAKKSLEYLVKHDVAGTLDDMLLDMLEVEPSRPIQFMRNWMSMQRKLNGIKAAAEENVKATVAEKKPEGAAFRLNLIDLNDADTKLVRAMFDKMDYDKKGTLDAKKVAAVAKAANCELTQENAKAAMEGLEGLTGPVTFEKFLKWYAKDPAGDGVWLTAVRAIMTKAKEAPTSPRMSPRAQSPRGRGPEPS